MLWKYLNELIYDSSIYLFKSKLNIYSKIKQQTQLTQEWPPHFQVNHFALSTPLKLSKFNPSIKN